MTRRKIKITRATINVRDYRTGVPAYEINPVMAGPDPGLCSNYKRRLHKGGAVTKVASDILIQKIEQENKMGYTHYFSTDKEIDPETWDLILHDAFHLIHESGVALTGWTAGYSVDAQKIDDPVLSPDMIAVNGYKDDSHETFGLERTVSQDFCKTVRKPYDKVVCGILIAAKYHAPDCISVSSDGDSDDWAEAFENTTKILGPEYVASFVLR